MSLVAIGRRNFHRCEISSATSERSRALSFRPVIFFFTSGFRDTIKAAPRRSRPSNRYPRPRCPFLENVHFSFVAREENREKVFRNRTVRSRVPCGYLGSWALRVDGYVDNFSTRIRLDRVRDHRNGFRPRLRVAK